MNRAIRVTAAIVGVSAGIACLEHGIFEMLQGSVRPDGLFITSIGPPCDPMVAWNACEPALTIVPNLLWTGVLATLIGAAMIIWSVWFLQRARGWAGLLLLSLAALLFGGGLFPPLIGTIASLSALRINRPLAATATAPTGLRRALARLYPVTLVVYLVLVFGQFVVGALFNDFLASVMVFYLVAVMGSLYVAILSAAAHDALTASPTRRPFSAGTVENI